MATFGFPPLLQFVRLQK